MRNTMLLGLTFVAVLACRPLARNQPPADKVAEVDGKAITAAEVDKAAGAQLAKLEEEIHNLRREKLDELIASRLLAGEAEKRKMSVDALLDREVFAKAAPVSDQDVDTFYQANKNRLQGQESALRPQIRSYLQQQRFREQRERFIQSLRSQSSVVVHLKAPPVFRAQVRETAAPVRGTPGGSVTIVEFSDFHCPFCRTVQPTLAQLLARYPGKLKLVFRNFPLDSLHPAARRAAEAAQCANEQGKFWEYHDRLFAGGADASPEKLKSIAGEVGLEVKQFDLCVSARKYETLVQQDLDEGERLGVNGTPGFFINGRMLSGAQPLDAFVKIIEAELQQKP